jgi:hypothetical protein
VITGLHSFRFFENETVRGVLDEARLEFENCKVLFDKSRLSPDVEIVFGVVRSASAINWLFKFLLTGSSCGSLFCIFLTSEDVTL